MSTVMPAATARADDPLAPAMASATTVSPKRYGYLAPVAANEVTGLVPPVSLTGVPADPAAALAPSSRLFKVVVWTRFWNELGQLVFHDHVAFLYRRDVQDDSIYGVTFLPDDSTCDTHGPLVPYHPVTRSCWYTRGFDGPQTFSFATGSQFSLVTGPLTVADIRVEHDFAAFQNAADSCSCDISVNGNDRCAGVSGAVPPTWEYQCAHDTTEIRL